MHSDVLNDILGRYQDVSFGTRAFLKARWHLTPYAAMAEKMPKTGRILDLGCGHGLLAMTMALAEPGREVLAVDHDQARVEAANKAAKGIANLFFEQGSVLAPPPGPFTGVTAIDVMHYFDRKIQNAILDHMHEMVAPGGIFIMREVNPQGGAISAWNRLYEKIATATGFTQASKKELTFRTIEEWTEVLKRAGFEVTSERCSSALFADILYVCRRLA